MKLVLKNTYFLHASSSHSFLKSLLPHLPFLFFKLVQKPPQVARMCDDFDSLLLNFSATGLHKSSTSNILNCFP